MLGKDLLIEGASEGSAVVVVSPNSTLTVVPYAIYRIESIPFHSNFIQIHHLVQKNFEIWQQKTLDLITREK